MAHNPHQKMFPHLYLIGTKCALVSASKYDGHFSVLTINDNFSWFLFQKKEKKLQGSCNNITTLNLGLFDFCEDFIIPQIRERYLGL